MNMNMQYSFVLVSLKKTLHRKIPSHIGIGSHFNGIKTLQNKVLRNIVAPWLVRNSDLPRELGSQDVASEIKRLLTKHEARLHQHVNVEAVQFLDTQNLTRRLKRIKFSVFSVKSEHSALAYNIPA